MRILIHAAVTNLHLQGWCINHHNLYICRRRELLHEDILNIALADKVVWEAKIV